MCKNATHSWRHMVQVAAESCKTSSITWTGPYARDLQRLIPIRVENQDPDQEGTLFVLLRIDRNRFPHLLASVAPDALTHCHGKRAGTNTKSIFIARPA